MLARKISRGKWQHKDYLAETEIRADAISGCLRTTDDTLSWWRCTDDREDVAEVALALAVASKIEKFDKIDIVVLPEVILADAGLAHQSTKGDTPVKDLQLRHVDLVRLDVERLATVARILSPRIRSSDRVLPFTKAQLMTLVTKAIHDKRLDVNDLNEKLREKLARHSDAPPS